MNNALRSGSAAATKSQEVLIKTMSSALNKLSHSTFKGTVYRGATLSDDVLAKYTPGKTIVEAAFTSTSKSIAGGYSNRNASFIITSKTGKLIQNISVAVNEEEVLFNPGTAFKVISETFDKASYSWKIVMEQVTP